MNIEKMREGFEAVLIEDCESSGIDAPDLRIRPCTLDDGSVIYMNDVTQACWWSYREGWKASRTALVIELPQQSGVNRDWNQAIRYCHQSIEAAGVKVKP